MYTWSIRSTRFGTRNIPGNIRVVFLCDMYFRHYRRKPILYANSAFRFLFQSNIFFFFTLFGLFKFGDSTINHTVFVNFR